VTRRLPSGWQCEQRGLRHAVIFAAILLHGVLRFPFIAGQLYVTTKRMNEPRGALRALSPYSGVSATLVGSTLPANRRRSTRLRHCNALAHDWHGI
jgi:hypothetical protein